MVMKKIFVLLIIFGLIGCATGGGEFGTGTFPSIGQGWTYVNHTKAGYSVHVHTESLRVEDYDDAVAELQLRVTSFTPPPQYSAKIPKGKMIFCRIYIKMYESWQDQYASGRAQSKIGEGQEIVIDCASKKFAEIEGITHFKHGSSPPYKYKFQWQSFYPTSSIGLIAYKFCS